MIGVSLICHGGMAEGIKDSVGLIIGEQEYFNTLGLFEGNDFEKFKEDVYNTIAGSDTGGGVIVFVDMMGASPFNAVSMNVNRLKEKNIKIRVISGANLPMLIETFMQRDMVDGIEELYKIALEAGQDSIKELFDELGPL